MTLTKLISRIKYFKKKSTSWFIKDYKLFKKMYENNLEFKISNNYPCVKDKFSISGNIGSGGHYFLQDIYVAREIFNNNPSKHIDIGSRIDGFIAHLSVFKEVEVFDIRPQSNIIKNVIFKQADLMNIDYDKINYCDSISCLHSIEHFGLGRYGDKIDPNGHLLGFNSITQILKKGGLFYFSVPMGIPNRVEFNAHRVFSLEYLKNWIEKDFIIEKFTYIDDDYKIFEDVKLNDLNVKNSCYCFHGCGIFTLKKK